MSSPIERYSPVTTTKRVVEKKSNYKYSSYSGSQDNLDQGSPLSSLETDVRRLGSPSKSLCIFYYIPSFIVKLEQFNNDLKLYSGFAFLNCMGVTLLNNTDCEKIKKVTVQFITIPLLAFFDFCFYCCRIILI